MWLRGEVPNRPPLRRPAAACDTLAMAGVAVGDTLTVAMVSPMVGDRVTLWVGERRITWVPAEPARLAEHLARGRIARTEREANRFREVVMVDAGLGKIIVMPRHASPDGSVPGDLLTGTVAGPAPEGDDAAWFAFGSWLTGILTAAAARSEYVVVEPGGWDPPNEPYALGIFTAEGEGGSWRVTLESNPRPDCAPNWPRGSDPRGHTLSAPVNPGSLDVSGPLLSEAIRCWAASPLDLALTFGASPAPPFPRPTGRNG